MDGKNLIAIVLIVMAGLFYACDSDNGSSTGTLKINLTDAPFPSDLVEEANVTINKIEIRKSDDSEESPFITISEEVMDFNLLDLTNGITESLIDMEIEAGTYDLIRLYVTDAGIVLSDGSSHEVKVPSGSQTGIKVFVKPDIVVTGGLTSELLLDFDVSQSFILQGNTNTPSGITGFIFKPTIKATNASTAGRIVGTVLDSEENAIEGTQVTVKDGEEVYTTTFTDENGGYTVLGVEAGTYTVIFEKEGYESMTTEDVEVVAANSTMQDGVLNVLSEE